MKNGSRFLIKPLIQSLFWFFLVLVTAKVLAQEGSETSILQKKQPPTAFKLVSPKDTAQIILNATFRWQAATDPEGKPVTYDFLISSKPDFENIVHSQYKLPQPFAIVDGNDNLKIGATYYWKVIAFDFDGASTASEQIYQFQVEGFSRSFNLISPVDESRIILNEIFSWEALFDPEGKPVTYDFLVSPTRDFETIIHSQLKLTEPYTILSNENAPNLDINVPYYWKVIAKNSANEFIMSNQTYVFYILKKKGEISLQVLVSSLQNNDALTNVQVTAINKFKENIEWLPGSFTDAENRVVKIGIAATGTVLDVTASADDHESEMKSDYDVTDVDPQPLPMQLNCPSCNEIFNSHFEGS